MLVLIAWLTYIHNFLFLFRNMPALKKDKMKRKKLYKFHIIEEKKIPVGRDHYTVPDKAKNA